MPNQFWRIEKSEETKQWDLYLGDFFAGAFSSQEQAEFWAETLLDWWHAAKFQGSSRGNGVQRRQKEGSPYYHKLAELERAMLSRALEDNNGNKTAAAKELGLKRTTFLEKWAALSDEAKALSLLG